MPLLNGETPEYLPMPSHEALMTRDDGHVFYIPFTGEILTSYRSFELTREYFDRISLYRSRIWTCAETGKQNLTFREAIESELKAVKKIEVKYPQVWVKPTLEIVQFSMNC